MHLHARKNNVCQNRNLLMQNIIIHIIMKKLFDDYLSVGKHDMWCVTAFENR